MDDVLLGIVLERLDQHRLGDEATDLLLASLDGDEVLASQLSAPQGERYSPPGAAAAARDPVGAYLSSVTVQGFRGIGPAATLKLKEGPGLTLVVGRNGSGKSSFAEGLEVLLTGDLMRWKSAPTVVKQGWRSKHAAGDSQVTAEFYVEGKGRATAGRCWPATSGTDIADSDAWVQVHGEKQAPITALGWDADLVEYRPFLSHAELEAFFGKPSDLHDLLANVLGLDDLTAADKRLQTAAKLHDYKLKEVKQDLERLRARLTALSGQDERASACLPALAGPGLARWDIDTVRAIATGSHPRSGDDGQIALLRGLANLTAPQAADVTRATTALREAVGKLTTLGGSAAIQARDLADLLDAALVHHQAHGDGPCPVCGNPGALTPAWHVATEQHRDRLRDEAREADEAVAAARSALHAARALIQPPPQSLTSASAADLGAAALAALAGTATEAWLRWADAPPGDERDIAVSLTALVGHLDATHAPLAAAITNLARQAAADLARRDDEWSPLATELAAWCEAAAEARATAQPAARLREARKWLTEATAELRDRRLAPLADQSRSIWADLRQESNVDLGEFRLTGMNTRRQLDLNVTIDGEPGAALGVMSQGEINALALSIFLPRATMSASPFRFLVIDDPVQAMDPAKVDGLARVLGKVARHRQVIVFTHDNRLAAAIRDLSIPATILEVTRQPGSNVTVRQCLDASSQALRDARALEKDSNVPLEVAERVIPGLCRTATEAAFSEAYWRTGLRRGRTRTEIGESMAENGTKRNLRAVAALALFGDAAEAGNVVSRINNQWGRDYADTFKALNTGAHEGYPGELADLIGDTRALVRKIGEKLS